MSRKSHSLLALMGVITGSAILVIAGVLVAYWIWLATPVMQAEERTKTELLALSYRDILIESVESGDRDRIRTNLGEILLLADPESGRALISRVEVKLSGGEVLAAGVPASSLGLSSFSVEMGLFSPATFELLGTMRLYRTFGFPEQQLVFWLMASVVIIVLILLQILLWRLLRPLRELAGQVASVDPQTLDALPALHGFTSSEMRALHDAVQGLLVRLRDARDITERQRKMLERRAGELARSNADLEGFAYVASHDLKAPLRGIHNIATWLEEDLSGVLEEESRRHMDLLRGRVRRLERLLDDLLAYSRAGRSDVVVKTVDSGQLVHALVEDLAPPPGMTFGIDPELPVFDTAPGPLELVLRNLVGNAIKHHDRDSGHITVSVRDRGALYEFSVADDGPGIPADFHDRVFDMFQTLKTRDQVEGSGMGLAIVKKMVESQGGMVWVASNDGGRGTTVRFTWGKTWSGEAGQEDE